MEISYNSRKTAIYKAYFSISSYIQTLLSVLEFHQISPDINRESRTVTAGREFNPALKKC